MFGSAANVKKKDCKATGHTHKNMSKSYKNMKEPQSKSKPSVKVLKENSSLLFGISNRLLKLMKTLSILGSLAKDRI